MNQKVFMKNQKMEFFEYLFRKSEILRYIEYAGFDILKSLPVSYEGGFSRVMSSIFPKKLISIHKIFYKISESGEIEKITLIGRLLIRLLNFLDKWMTPQTIFVIAEKNSSKKQKEFTNKTPVKSINQILSYRAK